ncbi:hypothetical protein HC891_27140 [Candidatus Gracilibacteria bacterium]|nr:hypothetical protein [Candidatus Gracilibacteria bacterium]
MQFSPPRTEPGDQAQQGPEQDVGRRKRQEHIEHAMDEESAQPQQRCAERRPPLSAQCLAIEHEA